MPSVPFLDQQDLHNFVALPDEYILESQGNPIIEDIAAAYEPRTDPSSTSDQKTTSDRPLDDSESRPVITINHTYESNKGNHAARHI